MTKTWTTHEQTQLEALYKTGHTSQDISEHMHRSIHSVNKALCRFQLRKICPKRPHRQLKIALRPQQHLPLRPDARLWDNVSGKLWLKAVAQNALVPKPIAQPHLLLNKLYRKNTGTQKPASSPHHYAPLSGGILWLKQRHHITIVSKNEDGTTAYQVNGGGWRYTSAPFNGPDQGIH